MRLTGAFMTLCALVACGEGRHASLATPVLSYNGSNPFPAVIGEPIALASAVFWTIGRSVTLSTSGNVTRAYARQRWLANHSSNMTPTCTRNFPCSLYH
jgi:hypothetical protein